MIGNDYKDSWEGYCMPVNESLLIKHRVLFANVSYSLNGQQQGQFRYVIETGDAMEKNNFDSVVYNGNEVCLGFFEAGFTKGGYEHGQQRQVHIEKINSSFENLKSAPGVTVIWCALIPSIGRSSVIGWYKNAEVFRLPNKIPYGEIPGRGDANFGYLYNVISSKRNCVALPYSEIIKSEWFAPRQKYYGFGFGQSNMWYAKEEKSENYVVSIMNKINNYSGENLVR